MDIKHSLNDANRQRLMRGRRRSGSDYFNTAIFLLVMTVGTCITVVQRWLDTEQNRKETENESEHDLHDQRIDSRRMVVDGNFCSEARIQDQI